MLATAWELKDNLGDRGPLNDKRQPKVWTLLIPIRQFGVMPTPIIGANLLGSTSLYCVASLLREGQGILLILSDLIKPQKITHIILATRRQGEEVWIIGYDSGSSADSLRASLETLFFQ
ncbi:hypothetical protein ACJX0J_028891, partial [Zea mays]